MKSLISLRCIVATAVAVSACSLVAVPRTCGAEARRADDAESFVVVPETTSPDGRYAIAWGLPKHPEIWRSVKQVADGSAKGAAAVYAKLAPVVEDSENYVVDLRAKKIVQKLSSNYWHVEDRYEVDEASQRDTFEAAWSPTSDVVVASHTHRWVTLSLAAVRIGAAGGAAMVDLEPVLEPAALKLFEKSMKKARLSADSVFTVFSGVQHREGLSFSVEASGSQGSDGEWSVGPARIDFALEPSEKGLVAKVSAVQADDDAPAEGSGASEDALAKADADLNRAYSTLRSKLSAKDADALKVEQRAWLKKRDKISDASARAEFVAERAKELEARAR